MLNNWGGTYRCSEGESSQAVQNDEHYQPQRESDRAMIATQISRVIAHYMIFLEFTDDDILDPDAAVQMMEQLGTTLRSWIKDFFES